MIIAVDINFEGAIDNVPVQLSDVWLCRRNLHQILVPSPSPPVYFKQTFPMDSVSRHGPASALGTSTCQLSASLLCGVSKDDILMLRAASSLCEWSVGATAFFWGGFTPHGDNKGGGRSLIQKAQSRLPQHLNADSESS